jgi:hypothetical protein
MFTPHRVIKLMAALLVLLGLLIGPAGVAPASAAAPCFYLSPAHSGLVLDVEGGSTADGARIVQWNKNGGSNQKFRFTYFANYMPADVFYIEPVSAAGIDKVLTVNRYAAGAQVVQFAYGGINATYQWWQRIPTSNGYKFRNVATGLYMDISGASQQAGAPLVQWYGSGGSNQEFRLQNAGC